MGEVGVYDRLARHLAELAMPLPYSEQLVEILEANLTPLQAEVALALPNRVTPLSFVSVDEIPAVGGLAEGDVLRILEELSRKGIVLSGRTASGKPGFSLWQNGFGFTQAFYWKGEDTPHARRMTELIRKYYANPRVFHEGRTLPGTKPYRYVPVGQSIKPSIQGVYSHHMMEDVIRDASVFAVGHCPCRVRRSLMGKGCHHPTEVCLKFNDLAQFAIDRGFMRRVTREEAMGIIRFAEQVGLVHFVDNAGGKVQHNCNCCGCSCWNVGPIRRREVPRDSIMATYFSRETDAEACIGCGACAEICPVGAVAVIDGAPVVDRDWCIGCGVCTTACPGGAIAMVPRPDRSMELPADNFKRLHELVLEERGFARSEKDRGGTKATQP